jgi:hypothetical protein
VPVSDYHERRQESQTGSIYVERTRRGNGASSATIQSTVNASQTWMVDNADTDGRLPFGVASSSPAGQEATANGGLSPLLDQYNNGNTPGGPPHCP